MCGTHDSRVVLRDVHEYLVQFDVLLREGMNQIVVMHPGNGENRLAISFGVVQPIQKVNASRARGRQTDAQFARVLGVCARHERRRFFMANLNEPNPILAACGALP